MKVKCSNCGAIWWKPFVLPKDYEKEAPTEKDLCFNCLQQLSAKENKET